MSHYKPDPSKSVNLTINGMPVTVPEGTRILEAARKVGVHIPTLCEHPDLCKRAVCRICVVECDGRGKLMAACANDVSEGVKVVTHNARVINIRKTIVEMLLANHPQDCLNCIRNKNCELQSLAADLGIRESSFRHDELKRRQPAMEGMALVRDMDKCVKCGRCVEVCQEQQTVRAINSSHRGIHYEISAPYGESPIDGSCALCGQCAQVCPVGAIYEYDQSAEAWAVLGDNERQTVAQIDPALGGAFDRALGLPSGTVSPGKLAAALKRLGFDKVVNARSSVSAAAAEKSRELLRRINEGGKLPLVAGCSQGWVKFVENYYGDLIDHVYPYNSPQQTAGEKTTTICIEPCIARKYQPQHTALTLTVNELSRMFTLIGIDFADLPESPFDDETGTQDGGVKFRAVQGTDGIEEAELKINGANAQFLVVHGLANARAVMESIRKGECGAAFVEVMCCPRPGDHPGCNCASRYMADASL
jgi:iron only hydrogenase large subunit-like protein